jgi:hypothetical protein
LVQAKLKKKNRTRNKRTILFNAQIPEDAQHKDQRERDDGLYKFNNIFPYFCNFTSLLPNKASSFGECYIQTYRKLYGFKNIVTEWSSFVSAYDKYLRLIQKLELAPFLLLSNAEHVVSIELYYGSFIVITIDINNKEQLHNIIISMEILSAQFNISGLLDTIQDMPCESICGNLRSIQWKQDNGSNLLASTLHQRLARV